MKTGNWIAGSLVAILLTFTTAAQAADPLFALRQDAATMDAYAHSLCDEVRVNLRNASNYPIIVAKVEVLESRIHLFQEILARPYSQQQLYTQLDVVDRLLVNVEDSVFDAARGNAWGHHHHHLQVDTRRAEQLLRAIDNTIHHMEHHVDDLRPVPQPIIHQRPIYSNPGWNQPGNGWNGGYNSHQPTGNVVNRPGISIGPGGVTIGRAVKFSFNQ